MLLLLKTDRKGLRTFGVQMAIAWPLLFSLLLPWLFGWAPPLWPWWLSALFGLLAFTYPPALYYPYRLWMAFAAVMAWINTRLLLGLVFYLMIWPLGLLLKVFGKLQYNNKPVGDSYWRVPDKMPAAKDLEEPF